MSETTYLAGGCFWGLEDLIAKLPGVLETEVGYMGGVRPNPTYEQVSTGVTHHAETVKVVFDPKVLSFEDLLLYFFKIHNPTTLDQQGNDIGSQYRSVIFTESQEHQATAQKVIDRVNQSGAWKAPLVTEIASGATFWKAEDYHQKYLEKKPDGYTCHWERKITF